MVVPSEALRQYQYDIAPNHIESPFETFRRYSGESRLTAGKLARLTCSEIGIGQPLEILDIGAGDGRFVETFSFYLRHNLGVESPVHFCWLEPNPGNVRKLQGVAESLSSPYTATVVQDRWESFHSDRKYHVIILSHVLYHFDDKDLDALFKKMISHLELGGVLFVVARQKGDEDYQFLQAFLERATGRPFREKTIDDAWKTTSRIKEHFPNGLEMYKRYVRSHIVFPFATNQRDAQNLVSFYLDKPWEELDNQLQAGVRAYLEGRPRYGQLQQVSGILVVKRTGNEE